MVAVERERGEPRAHRRDAIRLTSRAVCITSFLLVDELLFGRFEIALIDNGLDEGGDLSLSLRLSEPVRNEWGAS